MSGDGGGISVTINAIDSRSLVQTMRDNPQAILGPLRDAAKNRRYS
jgi:hypothetical protein